jgi:23S rRNA pseudouridine1911/1915/1917 synthase
MPEMYRPRHLTDVQATGDGRTLGALLAPLLGDQAERLIIQGAVWVDGVRTRDPGYAPAAEAAIRVRQPPPGRPNDVTLGAEHILYEDQALIAIDKPAGAYVDATPWDADTHVRGAMLRLLERRDGAAPRLHLVHRLDRDTSGVLLFSKLPAANPALQRTFVEGLAHKTYLCVCAGAPRDDETLLETGHGRGRYGMLRIYPRAEVGLALPGGGPVKVMQTRLVVAQRLDDAALVWAYPTTGRTHQIRLHMALLGCPLVGDVRYGGPAIWRGRRIEAHWLHAARLELAHPLTRQPIRIEAPLPWWASAPW